MLLKYYKLHNYLTKEQQLQTQKLELDRLKVNKDTLSNMISKLINQIKLNNIELFIKILLLS